MAGFEGPAALITGWLGGYAKRPKIPAAPKQDIRAVVESLVKSSESNFPLVSGLVGLINTFVADENTRLAERTLPGFGRFQAAQMGAATDLSEGRLPEGVQQALRRESAAMNIASGTAPSSYAPGNFGDFRHLFRTGREALGGIQLGSQLGTQALSRSNQFLPQFASPLSFMFTPQQASDIDWRNQMAKFDVQMARNIRSATPDPAKAAFAQGVGNDTNYWLGAMATMGAGGMFGGGGTPAAFKNPQF